MAIAMRMATLMQLHREETYVIPSPTQELIIRAESARRTLVCGLDRTLGERLEADDPVTSGCFTARTTCIRDRDPPCYYRRATSRHCFRATRRISQTHENPSPGPRLKTHLPLSRTRLWLLMKGDLYLPSSSKPITIGGPSIGVPLATTKALGHGSQTVSTP